MNKEYLNILVCPVTKAPLIYNEKKSELMCKASKLAYPIKNGIPIMLESEARVLKEEDLKNE